jgi:hypothetical protein
MATPPTFTTGAVLTAAQMNAVGLWLVKSQTIGTGVTSVTVTGAFSADYDNYRIVISGGTASTAANLLMGLGSSVTGYYGLLQYGTYAGSAYTAATNNNSTQWDFVGYCNTNYVGAAFDLIAPFTTRWTQILNAGWTPSTASGTFQGIHQVATSYTSFTIASAAAMTGGTISVYGYRKA